MGGDNNLQLDPDVAHYSVESVWQDSHAGVRHDVFGVVLPPFSIPQISQGVPALRFGHHLIDDLFQARPHSRSSGSQEILLPIGLSVDDESDLVGLPLHLVAVIPVAQ